MCGSRTTSGFRSSLQSKIPDDLGATGPLVSSGSAVDPSGKRLCRYPPVRTDGDLEAVVAGTDTLQSRTMAARSLCARNSSMGATPATIGTESGDLVFFVGVHARHDAANERFHPDRFDLVARPGRVGARKSPRCARDIAARNASLYDGDHMDGAFIPTRVEAALHVAGMVLLVGLVISFISAPWTVLPGAFFAGFAVCVSLAYVHAMQRETDGAWIRDFTFKTIGEQTRFWRYIWSPSGVRQSAQSLLRR